MSKTNVCLNTLYMSKDYKEVLKFYSYFESAKDLIKWMKNRPPAPVRIHETDGDTDVIVVIPTANINGDYARNVLNMFKKKHIIFVESRGSFFNYARSCNLGIAHALKYKPRWIALFNDDIYEIDPLETLFNKLLKVNEKNVFIVHINDSKNRISYPVILARYARRSLYLYNFMRVFNKKWDFMYRMLLILRIYGAEYTFATYDVKQIPFLDTTKVTFLTSGMFIISYYYAKRFNGKIFDENYINGIEDTDLHFSAYLNREPKAMINFRLGVIIGGSLGQDLSRNARGIANLIYFNYKFRNILNQ